jgi:acetyl esterase/lipase
MPFALDPELALVVEALGGLEALTRSPAARDDWQTVRANSDGGLALIESMLAKHEEIDRTDDEAISHDGARVLVRWYMGTSAPGSAVVYLHGGGMICGSVELYDRLVAAYVADSGVPMLAVDYRRAPEHPHPSPVEDSFAGLRWLHDHAGELGVDRERIALMGDSGGGGLAAAATLMARDRGVGVARQFLVHPMLDDRTTTPDPELVPFAGWSYDDNYTGWHALLGDAIGGDDVDPQAAPARATDLRGLPPTYIEVGELDIFRDESIEYAQRLSSAGTSVELHVHPGCAHGFDRMNPDADVVRRSRADRIRALQRV